MSYDVAHHIGVFKRGADELLVESELERKLARRTPLHIKEGFNPTRPDLHLGHTVQFNKLRQLQELGHHIIFLIGDFTGLIGQEALVRTLRNAFATGRIAHAFMLTGVRGVGKTTAARVLAKALNCVKGPTPTPCNECGNCQEITNGNAVDVLEIDGASNTGVDDVRELIIVGGGPVGLGLAIELGWRGIECLLVEQGDGTIVMPRANAIDVRTMEFCRRWGIADAVRGAGIPRDFPHTALYATSLAGYEIARFEPRNITWTHYYGKEDTYSRIDYILLSPAMARTWRSNETYILTLPNWGAGSDHRPIVATFATESR